MTTTRQKADVDAKTFGVEIVDVRLRRVELPPDVSEPVYARMESERRRVANELRSLGQAESEKIRADADRQREVILAEAYRTGAEAQGRRRCQGRGDLRAGLWREPRVLRVLPQPRGVPRDVPRPQRRDGARSERGILPLFPGPRRPGREGAQVASQDGKGRRRGGFAVDGVRAGAGRRGTAALPRAAACGATASASSCS